MRTDLETVSVAGSDSSLGGSRACSILAEVTGAGIGSSRESTDALELECVCAEEAAEIGSELALWSVVESGKVPEIGCSFKFGVSEAVVAISIEEDRLKREAKLDRLDFELSARTVDCFAGDEVAAFWSVDAAIAIGGDLEAVSFRSSRDCRFLCFSKKTVNKIRHKLGAGLSY